MLRIVLSLVLVFLIPMGAEALVLPEQVAKDCPNLRFAGEGRLRWLG